MNQIRLVVVDDHAVFTDALTAALAVHEDLELVGTAADEPGALQLVRRTQPDVVLTDFRLGDGDGDGVSLAATALRVWPRIRVLMLTAVEDEGLLLRAIQAGCTGFLTKTAPLSRVVEAIRAVAAGESLIPADLLARALPHVGGGKQPPGHTLTPREREILQLTADGLSTDAIADRLHLARTTVRNHVARCLRKLGAHSRVEAVAMASRRGYIRPPR